MKAKTQKDPRDLRNTDRDEMLRMAADIVSAYVSHNRLASKQISDMIHSVFDTLNGLNTVNRASQNGLKPAVPVRRSVMPDYIVCLEDGKKLKMLKRHLRTAYNLSPEDYRSKWNLPSDYPMVAPNYAKRRSEFAKQSGLGKKTKRQKTARQR